MLAVRRETMFVVWYRVSSSRNMYEVIQLQLIIIIQDIYQKDIYVVVRRDKSLVLQMHSFRVPSTSEKSEKCDLERTLGTFPAGLTKQIMPKQTDALLCFMAPILT